MTGSDAKPAPLYLLPGLICSDLVWSAQVDALAEYRPVAISGYGDARSLAVMAERVLADTPDRISVAGHSMGARVALEMYRLAPECIERLALFDTGVHPLVPGETEKRLALLQLGKEKGMAALVDAWLPPMVHPDRRSDPSFMEPLRQMCIDAGIEQFENQITALIERADLRPLLPAITCPTLVATGDEDAWSPPEQHREIAASLPNAELVIFKHSGHMAPCETPDLVTDALRTWLNRSVLQ